MSKNGELKTIVELCILFITLTICAMFISIAPTEFEPEKCEPTYITTDSQEIKDSLICLMQNEAHQFVKHIHPNCPDTVPVHIVKTALENDIDICFMLAQTQLETGFGKTGIGRESSRYSLFGVDRKFYSSYPEAIDDYVRILKNFYLADTISEQHLLANYVTKRGGYRYASNPDYEPLLTKYYNNITAKTTIHNLQNELRLMD